MASKDHSLDSGIAQAAYKEFLTCGFQKASLHKIAEKAGVTTGAIYTRYQNKDALFVSLLQGFFKTLEVIFSPAEQEFERARKSARAEDIIRAINVEKEYDIVVWYDDRYEIKLGGTDEMAYKIRYLCAILDQLSEYQAGTIDLSQAAEKKATFQPST